MNFKWKEDLLSYTFFVLIFCIGLAGIKSCQEFEIQLKLIEVSKIKAEKEGK